MLEIFNKLKPFFEDNYKEFGVREYAKLINVSPPSGSKILKEYKKQGLLKSRLDRRYLLFKINRESEIVKDLSRIYWRQKLKKLIDFLNNKLYSPTIILFGSLAKLEVMENSDIDLVVLKSISKKLNLTRFEKIYDREIQLFQFKSINNINKELRNNILNGYIIQGVI